MLLLVYFASLFPRLLGIGRKEYKNTVQTALLGEKRIDLTEEEECGREGGGKKGSGEEEDAKRGFVHPPPFLPEEKERESLK